MKIPFALALLLLSALPGRADEAAAPPSVTQGEEPSPQLVELERALTQKQEAKTKDLLPPEQYHEFIAEFRAKLDAVMALIPPNPENRGLHAQIISRLGDQERGQALAGLDQALKDDPKNPALLRAKAQIYYEQKNYPAAAEAARQAGPMALALLKMSEGRTADLGATPGVLPRTRAAASVADEESNKPYTLAIPGSAKLFDVPAFAGLEPNPPLFGGGPMHSEATRLWARASDGLVISGTGWLDSANASGGNYSAGFGKLGKEIVGKSLLTSGGLMKVLPEAGAWSFDKNYRLMTGDLTVVPEVSKAYFNLGKTVLVGVVEETSVAAKEWGDLLTFKKPTTYQFLKATAQTEMVLASFLPFGAAAKGAGVAVETAEVAGVSAARRALARSVALGGRELGEGVAERVALGAEERAVASSIGNGLGPGAASRSEFISTDAARREAMRLAGIPTGQQPISHMNTVPGRQYIYEVNGQRYAVTQQTTDRVMGHGPHWEAGPVKSPEHGLDPLGRYRHTNRGKVKVNYGTE